LVHVILITIYYGFIEPTPVITKFFYKNYGNLEIKLVCKLVPDLIQVNHFKTIIAQYLILFKKILKNRIKEHEIRAPDYNQPRL
jgi:hypothetical protein